MPVLPGDNTTFGQAAKEDQEKKSDSTEQQSKNTSSIDAQAAANAHKANLGPVLAQNLGEPLSKEETRKRTAELNKDN